MKKSSSRKLKKPDALFAKLVELTQPQADAPEGYYPISYWAERFKGKDESDVYRMLKAGVASGILETGMFRAFPGDKKRKHWKEA